MSKYLLKVNEIYRVDTESEVEEFLKELKKDTHFIVGKYSSKPKTKKEKGLVVDEWQEVAIEKIFNDPKEPVSNVTVTYDSENVYMYESPSNKNEESSNDFDADENFDELESSKLYDLGENFDGNFN